MSFDMIEALDPSFGLTNQLEGSETPLSWWSAVATENPSRPKPQSGPDSGSVNSKKVQ
jgi:hypothetical protein